MRSFASTNKPWRKSSYSAACGDCVEVGHLKDGCIGVRDSKDLAMHALGFTPGQWRTFVGDIKTDMDARR